MSVVTLDLAEQDAIRLFWLVQRESVDSKIYNDYWWKLAQRIQQSITEDCQPQEKEPPE